MTHRSLFIYVNPPKDTADFCGIFIPSESQNKSSVTVSLVSLESREDV